MIFNATLKKKKYNQLKIKNILKSSYRQHTAGSIVVCSSHATLCDPVCLPELLSWKCGGETSVLEVAGVTELRGHKAEWLMIHRFKRHRMASGKLGATKNILKQ